jgi:hypothetical protein
MCCMTAEGDTYCPCLVSSDPSRTWIFEHGVRDGVSLRVEPASSASVTQPIFEKYVDQLLIPAVEANRSLPGCAKKQGLPFCDNGAHCCEEVLSKLADMGSSSQVIGGTETDRSCYIKTSLGSVGFSPAPGLEISCNPGRSLVLFLESTRTNLTPRPGRPANNSTINDQQSENNAASSVESIWIPLGISFAERTQVDQPILYWSHSSRNMRSSWCKRSSEIRGTRRQCQATRRQRVKQYLEYNNLKSAPHPPYSPDCSKGQNSIVQKTSRNACVKCENGQRHFLPPGCRCKCPGGQRWITEPLRRIV